MSGCFLITRGVRQGCVISPWLFNIFMDKMIREAQEEFDGGVQLETSNVNLVLFADDVMMLAEKCEDMKRNLNALKKKSDKWGIQINWGKTNLMMISRNGGECNVTIDRQKLRYLQRIEGVTWLDT